MQSIGRVAGILSLVALVAVSQASYRKLRDAFSKNVLKYELVTPSTSVDGALDLTFSTAVAYPNFRYPFAPEDWSASNAVAIDMENLDPFPVTFSFKVDDRTGATQYGQAKYASATIPANSRMKFALTFEMLTSSNTGMVALPTIPGYTRMAQDNFQLNWANVLQYAIILDHPAQETHLRFYSIGPSTLNTDLEGLVDKYGQNSKVSYTGKFTSDASFASSNTSETADLKKNPKVADRDKWGGWAAGPTQTATGRFRVVKFNNKWWYVDPDGKRFLSFGMTEVGKNSFQTNVTSREEMFQGLPTATDPQAKFYGSFTGVYRGPVKAGTFYNHYAANLERKYGADYESLSMQRGFDRLKSWGFNTLGNWTDPEFKFARKMPYVATCAVTGSFATVNTGDNLWGPLPDPYDAAFAPAVDSVISKTTIAINDPYCVGWFVDNEMGWTGGAEENGRYGIALAVMAKTVASSPAKRQWIANLQAKYGQILNLNLAWNSNFASWAEVEAANTLPATTTVVKANDYLAFCGQFAAKYFSTINATIKKYDAKALYLGCRFYKFTPEVLAACAANVDVLSFNYYGAQITGDWSFLAQYDKPTMIGEFHFGATDRGMFGGGGYQVGSQAERAAQFTAYVNSVVDNPYMVGCHWHQYTDQPLAGRYCDGENGNIGFVSVTDVPYSDLVAAARTTLAAAYARRY